MHSQKNALKILNCSKATLSRYAKSGKLIVLKQGRNTYYDEQEVASLVHVVDENKKKFGKDIKQREKIIDKSKDLRKQYEVLAANDRLDAIGKEALRNATSDLIELGLFENFDKQCILNYALKVQAYNRYFVLSMDTDAISRSGSGGLTLHPYHKAMQYHEKQMLQLMDRMGLNPASRQKLSIVKDGNIEDPMEALLGS